MPKNNNGIWTDTQDEPEHSEEDVARALEDARAAEEAKKGESK